MKNVLTIAGSDSCGGAGIQADLKTFGALYTYGMSVVTAVTAQNTLGVADVRELDRGIVEEQLDCVFSDIAVDAVKIGMLSGVEVVLAVAAALKRYRAKNVVLDPVMISTSGRRLLSEEAQGKLTAELFPLADIVTPNLSEARALTGLDISDVAGMEAAAKEILKLGPASVIVKGGHLEGDAVDVFCDGRRFLHLKSRRFDTKNTHGTGCTFSSALAAFLARGFSVDEALFGAKEYVSTAIEHSLSIGAGHGPTNHFYSLYKAAGLE